jgi:hypothetical protein
MGQDGFYFPSEGRRAEEFFFFLALKNPTASAGFEPDNLGTKGQHGTSRPQKPFVRSYRFNLSVTSVLDGVGWSMPRPGRFTPG